MFPLHEIVNNDSIISLSLRMIYENSWCNYQQASEPFSFHSFVEVSVEVTSIFFIAFPNMFFYYYMENSSRKFLPSHSIPRTKRAQIKFNFSLAIMAALIFNGSMLHVTHWIYIAEHLTLASPSLRIKSHLSATLYTSASSREIKEHVRWVAKAIILSQCIFILLIAAW